MLHFEAGIYASIIDIYETFYVSKSCLFLVWPTFIFVWKVHMREIELTAAQVKNANICLAVALIQSESFTGAK